METVAEEGVGVKAIVQVNETAVRGELKEMVRQSVEETPNGLLDAEADRLCKAGRYERNAERVDTRAGTYDRGLLTTSGKVALKVPKLRTLAFDTQIIERYRRRESSVEEALIEMCLAGVSVRRVEDITTALWAEQVSPATIGELNQKVAERIEDWRNRQLTGRYEYVCLDGIWLKRSWGRRGKERGGAGGHGGEYGWLPGSAWGERGDERRPRELAEFSEAAKGKRLNRERTVRI